MVTIDDTRDAFAAKPRKTAVLPVGALEQHGAHLPVGTDTMLAEAVARALAEKLDAYLLPALAVSASIEHRNAPCTVYLRAETLAAVIRDIATSLRQSGYERLIVANGHGGNWILKPAVRELNRELAPFRAILLSPDLPAAIAQKIFEHPVGDVHGGEFETSLMLHLFPQHVGRLPAGGNRMLPPQPMLDYFDSTDLAPEGFWGWPEAATAEKGRLAFDALIAAGLKFIEEIADMERKLATKSGAAVTLRPMRSSDIAFANQLREIAGWNQTEMDWRGFLAYQPDGCFMAEVDGNPAGTATTIAYGDRFGWIGMVLVHPDQRRHGIGSKLLRHAIAYLQQRGVRSVKLDATPLGRKVYLPLGFVDEYDLSRYEGIAGARLQPRAAGVAPFTPKDLAEAAALDATAFGASREHVLTEMSTRNPELCFVARNERRQLTGFLIARHGARAVQVGPWIARDPRAAEQLFDACLSAAAGSTIFVDVPAPNTAGVVLMTTLGFKVQRTLTRMYLGENTAPGEPRLVYSISSPEKG
jgi:creatinine amidohydrolase